VIPAKTVNAMPSDAKDKVNGNRSTISSETGTQKNSSTQNRPEEGQ